MSFFFPGSYGNSYASYRNPYEIQRERQLAALQAQREREYQQQLQQQRRRQQQQQRYYRDPYGFIHPYPQQYDDEDNDNEEQYIEEETAWQQQEQQRLQREQEEREKEAARQAALAKKAKELRERKREEAERERIEQIRRKQQQKQHEEEKESIDVDEGEGPYDPFASFFGFAPFRRQQRRPQQQYQKPKKEQYQQQHTKNTQSVPPTKPQAQEQQQQTQQKNSAGPAKTAATPKPTSPPVKDPVTIIHEETPKSHITRIVHPHMGKVIHIDIHITPQPKDADLLVESDPATATQKEKLLHQDPESEPVDEEIEIESSPPSDNEESKQQEDQKMEEKQENNTTAPSSCSCAPCTSNCTSNCCTDNAGQGCISVEPQSPEIPPVVEAPNSTSAAKEAEKEKEKPQENSSNEIPSASPTRREDSDSDFFHVKETITPDNKTQLQPQQSIYTISSTPTQYVISVPVGTAIKSQLAVSVDYALPAVGLTINGGFMAGQTIKVPLERNQFGDADLHKLGAKFIEKANSHESNLLEIKVGRLETKGIIDIE